MSKANRYDEEFKRTLIDLYHNGKTQTSIIKEYGISQTAFSKWIKQYSTVETEDGEILTAKQIKELRANAYFMEKQHCVVQLKTLWEEILFNCTARVTVFRLLA